MMLHNAEEIGCYGIKCNDRLFGSTYKLRCLYDKPVWNEEYVFEPHNFYALCKNEPEQVDSCDK